MRRSSRWPALLFLIFVGWSPYGDSFEIRRATVDGGGGRSSGGVFILTATIGQPDAGAMQGGSYSLAGGFWLDSQGPQGSDQIFFDGFESPGAIP